MLTSPQRATLKADILADPTLSSQAMHADGHLAIAAIYNAAAVPDYWVWRTRVSRDDFTQKPSVDGTTFSWTGAGYITRSQGERDAWAAIFDKNGDVNPSLVSVRTAFGDIFSGGTAPAPANRTHLTTVSRRKVSRVEKLFASGAGTTVSPSTLDFEGSVTFRDIETARES